MVKKNKPLDINFIDKMVVNGAMDHIDVKATEILSRSVSDCPVDNGNLRASGKKIRDDNEHKCYIGFGSGISRSYAVIQHDHVGLHHKVGKAKWLQDNFDEITREMKKK